MGNQPSQPIQLASALPPYQPLNPLFVFGNEAHFGVLQKLSFSGADFSVIDPSGQTVLAVEGKVLSMRDNMQVHGLGGYLGTLRRKMMSFKPTWRFELPGQNEQGQSKGDFGLTIKREFGFKPKYSVFLGETEMYTARGNFLGHQFVIEMATATPGQFVPVAQTGRSLFQWQQRNKYQVRCAPGVDCLAILLLIMAIDQDQQQN